MVLVQDYGSVPAIRTADDYRSGKSKFNLLIIAVVATCAIAACVAMVNFQVR